MEPFKSDSIEILKAAKRKYKFSEVIVSYLRYDSVLGNLWIVKGDGNVVAVGWFGRDGTPKFNQRTYFYT